MDEANINQFIESDNGENISFSTVGKSKGTPLIVFPGLGNHRSILLLLERFARRYKLYVINIDRPGSGLSGNKTMTNTTDRVGRVIQNTLHVLKHLKVKGRIYILGQSCGVTYALQMAIYLQDTTHMLSVMHVFLVSPWVSLRNKSTNPLLRALKKVPPSLLSQGTVSALHFLNLRISSIYIEHQVVNKMLPHFGTEESDFPLSYRIAEREIEEDTGGIVADAILAMEKGGQKLPEWSERLKDCHMTVYQGERDEMVPFGAVIEEFYGKQAAVNIVWDGTHSLLFDPRVIIDIFKKVRCGFTNHKDDPNKLRIIKDISEMV